MEGVDLGGATLRIYGDRTALDREIEVLRRYTDQLERRGIKVKFDADTGQATRQVDQLTNKLDGLSALLDELGRAAHGDFGGLTEGLERATNAAGGTSGALGGTTGALSGLLGGASRAIPILGQLGMAAMGVQAIFSGVGGAISAALAPLQKFSHEADRFNQQVSKAGVFATRSYSIATPEGDILEKTSDQMRALRPVISREFQAIHREVAQISGATASEIQEGFNIILQNAGNLGTAAEDLSNITKLSTRTAAAINTLGIPAQQLRSEIMSLMTGNVQIYDELPTSLGYTSEKIKSLQAQGGTVFYDDLIEKLDKLYEGQKVMADSLSNVGSNYVDFFETISAAGGQRLEAGFAGALSSILNQLTSLEKTWITLFDSTATGVEPLLEILGQVGAMFVPIGAAIGSVFSMTMTGLSPILNMLGAILAPTLEIALGFFNLIAKIVEVNADRFNRLMRPINAMFSVFAGGDTDLIRDFFKTLGEQIAKTTKWADDLIDRFTGMIRGIVRLRAELQANNMMVQDPKTGQMRRLNEEERKEFVSERLFDYDKRTNFDGKYDIKSKTLDQESKAFFDEVSAKNQGWAGRDGSVSHRDLMRAQEMAEVRKRMHENDIRGLEQSLKLMQAQKSLQQAMTELTESRRRIDTARAGFAVTLASSPEVRANAETAQRELAARQEADRLQERRQVLQTERQIQERQAEIQMRQAQMQTTQMEILRMEATISRDKAKEAIKAQEEKLGLLGKEERIAATVKIQNGRVELQHREAILAQATRAVDLAQQNEGIVTQVAGIEQQRLGVQEQQLDVLAQQNRLTAEQAQMLTTITEREQTLRRTQEAISQELRKGKAEREDEIKTFERQETLLGEQIKLQKVLADQAKQRADQEVEAADRALNVARAREAAAGPGAGIREIIGAEVSALASGQEGMLSVADATRKLYDARERQLLQEQEAARTQQRLQHEREQSEQRIAQLRLKVAQFELQQQLRQEQVRIEQAKVQIQRDQLSNSLQQVVTASGGSGGAMANILPGTKGGPNWNEGFGWSARRGRNHNGQDLGLDVGDPIHSRLDGVVERLIGKFGEVGKAVVVKYDDGTAGLYGHVDPSVKEGQRVRAGERIATVTPDVRAGGQNNSHLHYELFDKNGNRVDPAAALRASMAVPAGQTMGAAPPAPVLPSRAGARPAAATGRILTPEQMYALYRQAGFSAADAERMTAIAQAESGGDTRAHNPRGRDNSYGFSQINMLGAMGPERRAQFGISSNEELYDPLVNARAAKAIFDQQGFGAWSVSTNGAITPAMKQRAAAAAANYSANPAAAAGSVGAAGFVPATTGEQGLLAAEQSVSILEQVLQANTAQLEMVENLIQNLGQRQGIERATLEGAQQGAIGNLRMDRNEAVVLQQALGSQKAQFYADIADTYGGWMSGAIKGALQQARQTGELDLAEFASSIMGGLADRLIEMTTDYLMAPIEQAMKKNIFKGLTGIDDEKLKEMVRQEQASQGQERAALVQERAADKQLAAADRIAGGAGAAAAPTDPAAGGAISLETVPYQQGGALGIETLPVPPAAPQGGYGSNAFMLGAMDGQQPSLFDPNTSGDWSSGAEFEKLDGAFDGLITGATDLGVNFQEGAKTSGMNMDKLQSGFGAVLGGLASLGMVFGGLQQIKKGGSGNVISGIGSILGGVGSALLGPLGGMFGGGAPAATPQMPGFPIPGRAMGGSANAGGRLLVGEWGPEVIDMPANGMVHNHNQLRSLMGDGGRGNSSAGMSLSMQFQTTRFMDRNWVDQEQLEEAAARAERNGAERGERRGAERVFDRIKHDPALRRELGIQRF